MQKAAHAYLQTQVTTTTQGDLLILLYDAAIKFLRQAKEYMAQRNYAQKGILISRAMDVISELDASLNGQKGGDLAGNLHKLYEFCNVTLLQGNLKMDPTKLDEVIKILGGLRSAFVQINTPTALAQPVQTPVLPVQTAPQPLVETAPAAPVQPVGLHGPQPQGPAGPAQPQPNTMQRRKIAGYGNL